MKKIIAVMAALLIALSSASLAEGLSSLTAQELTDLYRSVAEELGKRGITGREESPDGIPEAGRTEEDAVNRLMEFMDFWSTFDISNMLEFCSSDWKAETENDRQELFVLLGNRTPKSYAAEAIYGDSADTVRTVAVTALIDRNNGKDPAYYRLQIQMEKEGDGQWYVDPQSLQRYEAADNTPQPETTSEPGEAGEITDTTLLYYHPEGGQYYHLDPNCKTVHSKFQPLEGRFTYGELGDEKYKDLKPCPVCGAPARKAELPRYATLLDAMGDDGEHRTFGSNGDSLVFAMEKNGTFFRVVTILDDRAKEMFQEARDAEKTNTASDTFNAFDSFYTYARSLPVSYIEEFTDLPKEQDELDALTGKTIGELAEEGFTCCYYDDATIPEEPVIVTMSYGLYDYDFEVDATGDEYMKRQRKDDIGDLTVRNGSFSGISNFATNLLCNADGTFKPWDEIFTEEDLLMAEISWKIADAWDGGEPDREELIASLEEAYPDAADGIREMVESYRSEAAPLTCEEIVEQVLVPMALANDSEVSIQYSYSAEEVAEILRILNENGITPDENSSIIYATRTGEEAYEEIVIREVCEQAFGQVPGTWTLEKQDWLERQLVKAGLYDTYNNGLPGPDNMAYEEAEAFAFSSIREQYGEELPLEDRNIWRLCRYFRKGTEEDPGDHWSFRLQPLDPKYGEYTVFFDDADPAGSVSVDADIPDWTKPYTGEQLLTKFCSIYSWSEETWPQAVWQKLHGMMQKAELEPGTVFYSRCKSVQLTEYPEPGEQDIAREEAIRIAQDELKKDRAVPHSAVLTEYEGERSWLVDLKIYGEDEEAGNWIITIDSATGAVRSLAEGNTDEAFAPAAANEKAREGTLEFEDVVRIAGEAIQAQYPGLDPYDGAEYDISGSFGREFTVSFGTKSIRHGDITVTVAADGTVTGIDADDEELNGDNLFDRYRTIYGYYGHWEQERWVQLEKDMAELEPFTIDGQALKATHYPEESSVAIRHEQAQELAMKATGTRTAEVNTCVLVDAQPHPVWIMRVLTRGSTDTDPIIAIDAETGKVAFTEGYTVDETPAYVMYSLPETWRKLEQGMNEAEATPAPLPDGKPWYWGKNFAPQAFWDQMGHFLDGQGITEENIEEYAVKWDEIYGGIDFWPQEYQAAYHLHLLSEESLRDPDFAYMPFPDPARKSQEEIGEIARSALHACADEVIGKDGVEKLKAASALYSDSRNPKNDGRYGKPVWWVWFYAWSDEDEAWNDMQGYAILDEDGNVLTCGAGEI